MFTSADCSRLMHPFSVSTPSSPRQHFSSPVFCLQFLERYQQHLHSLNYFNSSGVVTFLFWRAKRILVLGFFFGLCEPNFCVVLAPIFLTEKGECRANGHGQPGSGLPSQAHGERQPHIQGRAGSLVGQVGTQLGLRPALPARPAPGRGLGTP